MSPLKNPVSRFLLSTFESVFGRLSDRNLHKNVLRSMPTIYSAITSIQSRWNVEENGECQRPVFIFSAGWRSGSTLLQRLILSSENILMWGEPYAHCDYIRKMADSLKIFQSDLPREQFFIDHYQSDGDPGNKVSDAWVANLYPMPTDLIEAHREFFLRLFLNPAKDAGYSRWGVKEVRLSADYAYYLKFLFPEAKFLFLYRDPYKAYQSYKTFRAWYNVWPETPVFTPVQFGKHWKELLDSYISSHKSVDGFLIKYEDLCHGNLDYDALAEYLDEPVNREILETKVAGQRATNEQGLSSLEIRLLRSVVEPTASKLGYSG